MKVLLYVPLNPTTPRIYARTITSIFTLHWPHPLEIVFGKEDMAAHPDKKAAYQNLTDKYNRARRMTLDGGYDALFTVECDMIIPPLTLERLSRIDADVAYGLYVSRHGQNRWLAYDHVGEHFTGASYSDIPDVARSSWGKVVETKGVGMGCTFIHRHVLEQIEFRCPRAMAANDWYFSLDLQSAGLIQKHDLGVVCGHIQGAPSPKIYWPAPDGKYSIEFFDEAPPERVDLTKQVEITVDSFGSKHLFPAMEAIK
jgi:hypothetical protein